MKIEVYNSPGVDGLKQFKSLVPVFKKIASSLPGRGDLVAVNLVGRRKITELNKKYKGRRGSAEVLTFDYGSDEPTTDEGDPRGEIYLYYGKASKAARRLGVSGRAYLLRLFVHGICHLMGYEHGSEKEAKKMEEVEKKLLRHHLSSNVIEKMI